MFKRGITRREREVTDLNEIKAILDKVGEYAKNVFFKFSFHYEQLKKKGLPSDFLSDYWTC